MRSSSGRACSKGVPPAVSAILRVSDYTDCGKYLNNDIGEAAANPRYFGRAAAEV